MTDFFIGDTHFGHTNIIKFVPQRSHFKNIHEHDEFLIERWNSVVKDDDTVYHLGDVFFGNDNLGNSVLCRLRGHKHCILGNHDRSARTKVIMKYFEKVYGAKYYQKGVLTHIPVHPDQLEHRFQYNIHGHKHEHKLADKRYINVSVEQINFTPISWEELKEKFINAH